MTTAGRMLVRMARVSRGFGRQRVIHPLQASVVNPLVRGAFRFGIPDPGDALLETTGRRTGKPRLTPVCDGLEAETFWIVAESGRNANWVRNIEANPRVRVRVPRGAWLTGTAHILDDDDSVERQRTLARGNFARRLCVRASGAMATNMCTVRVDLDPR
jgi:deazaflavin-dependent oxidoreductase (nitroreductase family)